jgi:hypothetical protein
MGGFNVSARQAWHIDQKDQDLTVLIHESHNEIAQKDLIDQGLIHEIYKIHAKSS